MDFRAESRAVSLSRSRRALFGLARSVAAGGLLAVCGALLAPLAADAAPSGSISGNVTSAATHGALEHIQVCPIQEISEHEFRVGACAQTNAEGKYKISLEPGSYKVEFSPAFMCGIGGCKQANYITQYYKNKARLSSADPVSVEAGKTHEEINAEMQGGGQITGKVTDAAAHALEHIRVCALEPEGQFTFFVHCAETGAGGNYAISGLATAEDLVEFSAGFECEISKCTRLNYISQYWNTKSSFGEATPVKVEAGQTAPNINAEMHVGGRITGKVTSGGTPIEGAIVCPVAVPTVGFSECALTNAQGEYTIIGLASGKYKIEFTGTTCPPLGGGECAAVYVPQFYNGKATGEAAEAVNVVAGETVPGIDAVMVPIKGPPPPPPPPPPAPSKGVGGTSSGSGAGSSASGSGSNAGSAGAQGGVKAAHTAKPLTQAQKLAKAIAACQKLKKSKRAKCIAAAKKRYPLSKHKPHKKTKKH